MRNPNGYGSIVKLSGKRRKPFLVRATAREVYNADTGKVTVQRQNIGTFTTRREAMEALAEYNRDPYDINARKLTFAHMFDLYFEAKYVNTTKTFSKSSLYSPALPSRIVPNFTTWSLPTSAKYTCRPLLTTAPVSTPAWS